MQVGIDASRAFLKRRTGIEEYAYQTIRHLRTAIPETDSVVLYVRKKLAFREGRFRLIFPEIDFSLPANWRVRGIWAPRFWTQIALSLEMLSQSPDALFVPAHTVPIIHPRKTVVTIHGLEYEFCPKAYLFWARLYMRVSIRFSCRVAETVICVSENTKRDVMRLYDVPEKKIRVVYEGFDRIENPCPPDRREELRIKNKNPYLLFIGRLEERKNIVRIIEAFEMLKKKYDIPHELVLAGKPGYGYERIAASILHSPFSIHIKELGYVSEEKKWSLLRNADVFLFPTLYEGFGIPILEAQSVGVPVVTSDVSSLPEVAADGAMYVDPLNVKSIAEGIRKVLSDQALRDGIIEKAAHNVNRFGWERCAREIGIILSLEED